MPSQLWAVQDALAAVLTSALDVRVLNGPEKLVGNPPPVMVLVGGDGETADDDFATATQTRSGMGNDWREEAGTVTSVIWAQSGSDLAALRAAAKTVLDDCEAAIQADRTLGGALDDKTAALAEVTEVRKREYQTKAGPVVRVTFVVSYGALLTT